MSKKIKIKSAPGTKPPGNTLGTLDLVDQGLYFEETGTPGSGQFLLYQPSVPVPPIQARVITTTPSPLTTNTDFTFTWANLNWSITNFVISFTKSGGSDHGSASGSWSATPVTVADDLPSGTGGDPETGTFQASDTVDAEGESSASATA